MALQYIYTLYNMWKKVLGVDKLKSLYKKGKVHGEEYWMFGYYQLLWFQNVQMLAVLPLFLINEDVPKACLKSFIFSK